MSLNFDKGYNPNLGTTGRCSWHFDSFAALVAGASYVTFPEYAESDNRTDRVLEPSKRVIRNIGHVALPELPNVIDEETKDTMH